jgi:hypothetical protein
MTIKYCSGVAGNSLRINDYKVAGPEWGGGETIREWNITDPEKLKYIRDEIDDELKKQTKAEQIIESLDVYDKYCFVVGENDVISILDHSKETEYFYKSHFTVYLVGGKKPHIEIINCGVMITYKAEE